MNFKSDKVSPVLNSVHSAEFSTLVHLMRVPLSDGVSSSHRYCSNLHTRNYVLIAPAQQGLS